MRCFHLLLYDVVQKKLLNDNNNVDDYDDDVDDCDTVGYHMNMNTWV